ncbi:lipase 1-like [Melitaea cinxia]|uniref:lipase 1-like n=1 Tax=Melitaea cinxia TaxID=113334 RepID=UPI001E271A40|nr:lipase 1-like [Melitaea cinxia]
MLIITVFLSCVAIVSCGHSPNAEYIEELVRNNAFGARISDNIMEDATLDLASLVRKYNYPFEEHSVTTEDGYILGLHRIPHGRDSNNTGGDKPVVFLMHGLTSASSDHIIMGPGSGLAYILAEEGYDVWLGNARGNYFSRNHRTLNPNNQRSGFWNFSWDEIGNMDLPALIDYTLQYTGKSALHYIGFSQGTTSFFVMASLRPEYNQKIISMHALAPVAYMEHSRNILFHLLAPHANNLEALARLIGLGEVFPNTELFTKVGEIFCADEAITQPICSSIIFLICGWNENQHNATMLPVMLGHTPAGAAIRQFAHYGQSITNKDFRRYDHGLLENIVTYGSAIPPRYDLSQITAPVFLHYSDGDPLADPADVDRLHRGLGRSMGKFRVPQATFSHIDFIWGIDAKTLLFDSVIQLMKVMEAIS